MSGTIQGAPQGGVLALDLASVVGYAYGHIKARHPLAGTWHLPKTGGEGARYAAFENQLADTLEQWAPERMILEAHLPLPAMNNVASARQQLGLRAIAYSEAYRAMIQISEIDAITCRMTVLGYARPRTGDIKAAVVGFCRHHGIAVPDHNAADAAVIWLWYQNQLTNSSPLFGNRLQ